MIYEYSDRFSDRFIIASVRHDGIQIRAVGQRYHNRMDKPASRKRARSVKGLSTCIFLFIPMRDATVRETVALSSNGAVTALRE